MVNVVFDGFGWWGERDFESVNKQIGGTYRVTYSAFTLTKDDERKFNYTNDLSHVTQLLPTSTPAHKDCEFTRVKQIFLNGEFLEYPAIFVDEDLEYCTRVTIVGAVDPVFTIIKSKDNTLVIAKLDESIKSDYPLSMPDIDTSFPAPDLIDPSQNNVVFTIDTNHSMCNDEFTIALKAWTAVLASSPTRPKSGSRKTLILNWLNANHSKLTHSAKVRISVLLNPDNGGAPPSS